MNEKSRNQFQDIYKVNVKKIMEIIKEQEKNNEKPERNKKIGGNKSGRNEESIERGR